MGIGMEVTTIMHLLISRRHQTRLEKIQTQHAKLTDRHSLSRNSLRKNRHPTRGLGRRIGHHHRQKIIRRAKVLKVPENHQKLKKSKNGHTLRFCTLKKPCQVGFLFIQGKIDISTNMLYILSIIKFIKKTNRIYYFYLDIYSKVSIIFYLLFQCIYFLEFLML